MALLLNTVILPVLRLTAVNNKVAKVLHSATVHSINLSVNSPKISSTLTPAGGPSTTCNNVPPISVFIKNNDAGDANTR